MKCVRRVKVASGSRAREKLLWNPTHRKERDERGTRHPPTSVILKEAL
jgi:hypothetical protein